jgi:hypothetical protein
MLRGRSILSVLDTATSQRVSIVVQTESPIDRLVRYLGWIACTQIGTAIKLNEVSGRICQLQHTSEMLRRGFSVAVTNGSANWFSKRKFPEVDFRQHFRTDEIWNSSKYFCRWDNEIIYLPSKNAVVLWVTVTWIRDFYDHLSFIGYSERNSPVRLSKTKLLTTELISQ